MLSFVAFKETIDQQFEEDIALFFQRTPYADHLTNPETPLDEAYYVRHRVETVKRIQMTARTDALALAAMINEEYDLARKWAKYTLQEMHHDLMFLKDLQAHGYTRAQVDAIEPFASTKSLGRYLEQSIDTYGPLTAVAYSLFVEWNSERYSRKTVAKAEKIYSAKHVDGSKAHVHFDEEHDHYQLIVNMAHRLIRNDEHEKQFFHMTREIAGFFRAYFAELYHRTIAPSPSDSLAMSTP